MILGIGPERWDHDNPSQRRTLIDQDHRDDVSSDRRTVLTLAVMVALGTMAIIAMVLMMLLR